MKSLNIAKDRAFVASICAGAFRRKGDRIAPFLLGSILGKKAGNSGKQKRYFRRTSDIERCKELDDSELIKVIITQNKEAYRELFRRYEKKLFSYVYHMVKNREETEDLIQEVFVKTYRNIDKFDVDRKFSSWIYRIAHNETINFLKRKNKRQLISWDDVATTKDKLEMNSSEDFINDVWAHKEISAEVDEALKKLPEKYRKVLFLRYFSEYSYDKIALIIHKPINTVGTLINRAKKKLLDIVKKEEAGRKSKK